MILMMENLFEPIVYELNIPTLVASCSLLVGLIALATREKGKGLDKKEMYVHFATSELLLSKPDFINNQLKLLWEDEEIESLYLLQIYISNDGQKIIQSSDFIESPVLTLEGYNNIISTNIFTSDETTKVKIEKRDEVTIELKIDDFEPNNLIKIEVLYESLDEEPKQYLKYYLKEDNKRKDVNLNYFRKGGADRGEYISEYLHMNMWVIFIYTGIVAALELLILKFGIGIKPLNGEFSMGWVFLFWVIPFIVFIHSVNVTMKDYRKIARNWSLMIEWLKK